jgi:hypothetical protein
MKKYELEFKGMKWTAETQGGILFDISVDMFGDGMLIKTREMIPLDHDDNDDDDTNEFKKRIKALIKTDELKSNNIIMSNISSLGVNVGTRRKEISLDNRLYYRIKNLANMTKFINQAILEKLERDGLLTDQNE